MVEITSEEQNKVKRMKRTEDSFKDLWDNIKHTNIRIIGVPKEEERKKGYEKIFEEIIVENFPQMEKKIANQVQEPQKVPYTINPTRNTPVLVTQSCPTLKKIANQVQEPQRVPYMINPRKTHQCWSLSGV